MQRTYLACGAATLMILMACGPALDGAAVSLDKAAAAAGARTPCASGGYNLDGATGGDTYTMPEIAVVYSKGDEYPNFEKREHDFLHGFHLVKLQSDDQPR
jgi:hypothetical protein